MAECFAVAQKIIQLPPLQRTFSTILCRSLCGGIKNKLSPRQKQIETPIALFTPCWLTK